ncbi:hypothetical protein EJ110_NYTH19271 [Nymphaea thermarum]|nr:hypothetical protein EJ110_NYTH19271 [Nymphaea thermarum]
MKSSPFSSLITKMNGGNYEMWAMQVKRTLIAHDKEHLILEPEPVQKVGRYGTWFKDNSLVMVWIVGTFSQDIANEVLHKESAKDMWDSLAATYSQARNETRIMQLHHDIHQMRQDGRPLHTYYSSLKSMFERLNSYFPACKCEQQKAYRDMLMVEVFLSGLDSVYESAKNQMLTSPSIPPIDEAYSRLSRIPIPAATVPDTTSAMLATRGRGDDLDMPIAHRKGKHNCTLHPISVDYEHEREKGCDPGTEKEGQRLFGQVYYRRGARTEEETCGFGGPGQQVEQMASLTSYWGGFGAWDLLTTTTKISREAPSYNDEDLRLSAVKQQPTSSHAATPTRISASLP